MAMALLTARNYKGTNKVHAILHIVLYSIITQSLLQSCLWFNYMLIFRENFLHIDVFYEELKYEEVEEQEAFPILALFGEIGGFMGT